MRRTIAFALALAAAVAACGDGGSSVQEPNGEALMNPQSPEMNQSAPAQYRVRMETSAGPLVIEVRRDWAPNGADRFYNLVRHGYYDECRFFRVVPGFVVQWGMHGNPEVMKKWIDATIADDPVKETNARGTVTFAKTNSPNSRSTQLFINLRDNPRLDGMGFAPIGRVVEGMAAVEAINPEYGEGPRQDRIFERGNEYLVEQFPNLTYIEKAQVAD